MATTAAATSATTTPKKAMTPKPNVQDSMKSTWRTSPKENWSLAHHIIDFFNAYPVDIDKPVPVHDKSDPTPHMSDIAVVIWVLFYALIPVSIHQAWLSVTGYESIGRFALFNLYFTAFNFTVIREVHVLRRVGHMTGFLDGDEHERDGIPDVGVAKVAAALYKTTGSRIALSILVSYDPAEPPTEVMSNPKWWAWLFLQIGLYSVVLDFWFYWYHRAMHDVSFLWRYHRTHHLTKHPNPLLSAYADHEQEFFDMVGVPLMTWATLCVMGISMGFYEWWICHQFIAFTEVFGHSGLRLYGAPPSTFSWLLRATGTELVVEDHDMHHRKGYRKTHNYGKQTGIWDILFGTRGDRIEMAKDNVDRGQAIYIPIF
ncbi:Sterol desaturase/sphingolipid hydroxylase, fatty acid hydroxylase superfamily [Geosmithia morbida]|uniref:Sterol desaturase/sphingolipid hydroxylase, fatty acid hydroxylase superfamily n=1 Tax=Geosmithia morbida TaxID=1094350 RepID=A0A9P5CYX0_9HYPO|nr:Sterol desaturase/sphingolipid hydroxylase, fatty acid hydroxylase superfamily [Geosmithia morbida]KAF4120918.1 Sterol desaturase/sphingolipid hydroxylase, fatty acid hydroxylase superfamily [Geosmithia morbida]